MSDAVDTVENAVETQYGCPAQDSCGQRVLYASRDQYVSVIKALADEGYEMCVDLTGVDYLAMPHRTIGFGIHAERFEVVVNLLSLSQRKREFEYECRFLQMMQHCQHCLMFTRAQKLMNVKLSTCSELCLQVILT